MYGSAGSLGFLNISLAPCAVMTTLFLTSTDPSVIGVKSIGVAAIAFRATFTYRRLINRTILAQPPAAIAHRPSRLANRSTQRGVVSVGRHPRLFRAASAASAGAPGSRCSAPDFWYPVMSSSLIPRDRSS